MHTKERWYHGITRYQWTILLLASAGWVFDVYEGQIFNITRRHLLSDILPAGAGDAEVKKYGDMFLAIFLLGGTIGGLAAGSLADRLGRRPIMILTIVVYSIFSGMTYFVTELWQVATLRFLVAMGVGGEWAVAASLVAEVFPTRARAYASAIFHSTSVLGTWLAALAGMAVGAQWRYAYLLGILPALLVVWIRATMKEPEQWLAKRSQGANVRSGSFRELLGNPMWRNRALLGMGLAAIGLGTFWSVTVAGQDLAHRLLIRGGEDAQSAASHSQFAYGVVQAAGGGVGLLAFGPLCARLGRRRAFVTMQLLAFLIVPVICYAPQTYMQLLLCLPVFGLLTLAIHAGYAIYFPELFPTHLRATGTSACFNGGRVAAVAVLLFSGWLKAQPGMDLGMAVSLLSILFLVGAVLALFLPETRGQELPE